MRGALATSKLSHALAALLGIVLAAGVTIAVTPDHHVTVRVGGQATVPTPPAAIVVHGTATTTTATKVVQVTQSARSVASTLAVGAARGTNDLKPREKPSLPKLSGPIVGPVAQLQPPFAADSMPGCRTRFFTTNWSARSGNAKPSLFWLHYTAGPDLPGSRADVDGLTAFGNQPSAAVSWHLNMDKDGNCDYNVPLRYKAWTEADANSTGIGIEVAGKGNPPYLRAGGYRELARIYLEIHRRYNIPLRLGGVSNCSPTRSGIVTHWMGGPCSGGHVDIKPLDLNAVIGTLKHYVAADLCNATCRLRARHLVTHQRLVKNHCATGGAGGRPRLGGYCQVLRARNAQIHLAAKTHRISLAGTYG
jgi:hypothetical protein